MSAQSFMQAFEIGVKNSFVNGISDKEIASKKKEEKVEREKTAEIIKNKDKQKNQTENNASLVEIIQQKFPKASEQVKAEIKSIMEMYSITTFRDSEKLSTEGLEKIVEALNK